MNKILILEDDTNISKLFKDVLAKYGKIFTAKNEDEMNDLISSNYFSLIISDYFLENSNGIDLVKKIFSKVGHVPVILISAYPTVDMLQDGIDLKVLSFMRKPINFQQLIEKVESVLLLDAHYEFNQMNLTLKNSSYTMVMNNEDETQLTEIQFKILRYFLDNKDKIAEREQMIAHIWGQKMLGSENILDTHLLNLKKKVPFLKDHLKTLPRVGYILNTERN